MAIILGNALQAYDDKTSERCVEQVNAAIGAAWNEQPTQPPTGATNTSTDALLREIRDLKLEISSIKKGGDGEGGGSGGGGKRNNKWQLTKRGDKITHNNKTWWWCPHHRKGNGCYVRNKPNNHSKWEESKKHQKAGNQNTKTFVSTN